MKKNIPIPLEKCISPKFTTRRRKIQENHSPSEEFPKNVGGRPFKKRQNARQKAASGKPFRPYKDGTKIIDSRNITDYIDTKVRQMKIVALYKLDTFIFGKFGQNPKVLPPPSIVASSLLQSFGRNSVLYQICYSKPCYFKILQFDI